MDEASLYMLWVLLAWGKKTSCSFWMHGFIGSILPAGVCFLAGDAHLAGVVYQGNPRNDAPPPFFLLLCDDCL